MTKLPSEFYEEGLSDRKPYEDRAEDIASISLPYLVVDDSSNKDSNMDSSLSQSFNGMLVNNLKAKMGMSLMPPSTSSFRFEPDAAELQNLFGENQTGREEFFKAISLQADSVTKEMEIQQIRTELFEMIAHLIVSGSIVAEKIDRDGIALHPLKNFVVKLDNRGRELAICVKEVLPYESLPQDYTPSSEQEEYELYTMIHYDRDTQKWIMRQDIDGELIGDEKTYTDDNRPFRYFGWTWVRGNKYHRPFAEDYYEDMQQVDKLSSVNTDGSIIAAKSLLFVNERGNRTRKKDVAESANGDVLDGSADDVTSFQLNKNYDFQVSNDREARIMKTLEKCFLDTGSITRDAERVTAEEIRFMAQQLESSTLAGIYSKLSVQWSKWIVTQIMSEIGVKFDSIDVKVLTGLDALGRSSEAQKLDSFVQRVMAMQKAHYLKDTELINRYAGYDGINTVGLLKTEEEVQTEIQKAQQQQQQQALGESVAQGAGQAVSKSVV